MFQKHPESVTSPTVLEDSLSCWDVWLVPHRLRVLLLFTQLLCEVPCEQWAMELCLSLIEIYSELGSVEADL